MEVPNSSNVDRPSPARYGSVNLRPPVDVLEFGNSANVDRPANPEAETSEEKASSIDLSHGFSEFSQSGDSLRFGGSVNFLSHIDGGSYSSVENYHAQAGRKLQLGPPQEDLELYDLCGTTNLAFIRGESIFLVVDSRATDEEVHSIRCDAIEKYMEFAHVLPDIIATKSGNMWACHRLRDAIIHRVQQEGPLPFDAIVEFATEYLVEQMRPGVRDEAKQKICIGC
ncbi:hypothetical protein OROGR_032382 [Orobanche gracilis]